MQFYVIPEDGQEHFLSAVFFSLPYSHWPFFSSHLPFFPQIWPRAHGSHQVGSFHIFLMLINPSIYCTHMHVYIYIA